MVAEEACVVQKTERPRLITEGSTVLAETLM